MSISEQVKELRKISQQYPVNIDIDLFERILNEAADTIEALFAKLADMERSAEDCGGGWIYCGDGKNLPEDGESVFVQINGKYKNITFENAFEFASYSKTDGWILESYPDWDSPEVVAWREFPEQYEP